MGVDLKELVERLEKAARGGDSAAVVGALRQIRFAALLLAAEFDRGETVEALLSGHDMKEGMKVQNEDGETALMASGELQQNQ